MPSKKKVPPRPPVLEWIMAALGAAVVLATLTLLLKDAGHAQSPPAITAHVVEVRPLPDTRRAVEVEMINTGDETAAQVQVTLMGSTARADYVPGQGKARVTLIVPADPAGTTPVVQGWSEP